MKGWNGGAEDTRQGKWKLHWPVDRAAHKQGYIKIRCEGTMFRQKEDHMKTRCLTILFSCAAVLALGAPLQKPHVVFVTFDDLSRESIGIHGCPVPDITPNMDRIARNGMRFEHFHVQSGNCTPSRNIIMSGMYQQHNRVFSLGKEGAGNHHLLNTMPSVFRAAGYHTGIMGKNSHQCAFQPFSGWDREYDSYGSTKTPANVYPRTVEAIADAKKLGKPLFFNLNIYDPHTGWYGWNSRSGPKQETANHPSRIYGPGDVPYPSWFPPLSRRAQIGTTKDGTEGVDMMLEVAAYYNTVKRADDSLGQMLKAFDEAGLTDQLIIVLISDHGVQLPGGKTTLYHEGSVSPLFVQWPGVTKPGAVNSTHLIAAMDLLPTFCEIIGLPIPSELDGRSIVPILKGGQPKAWRSFIYKQQNDRNKSRAIQTKEWLYINNHWADGKQSFGSVTTGMHSWKLFTDALEHPETAPQTKKWIQRIHYRMPEELYHVASDPGCLRNLADSDAHADQLQAVRRLMEAEAVASGDNLVLEAIRRPRDPAVQREAVKRLITQRTEQSSDPDYARDVMYDPHDGWQAIDNTLFEPFGEWGIWQAEGPGVGLNPNNGYDTAGDSCVEFDGAKADVCRIVTSRPIDASELEQLKLQFRIPQKARKKRGRRDAGGKGPKVLNQTRLSVQYRAGGNWRPLETLSGRKIPGDHTLVLDPPQDGWPKPLQLAIQADFAGKGGYIPFDAVRLTARQDWAVHDHETATLAASDLATIELDYRFRADTAGPDDRLLVEYRTGEGWETAHAHDYSYVLLPGTTYSGRVVFTSDDHDLTDSFRVRFRSPGKAVQVSHVRLRSRGKIK